MFKTVLKFGLVGILNTAIDYTLLQVVVFIFSIQGGFPLFAANTFSSTIAGVNSFLFNKRWTFKNSDNRYVRQVVAFTIANVISIGVNDTCVVLLNHIFPAHIYLLTYMIKSIFITKAIAILFTMAFNFVVYKNFVFKNASDVEILADL